jgi:hypothetical protein
MRSLLMPKEHLKLVNHTGWYYGQQDENNNNKKKRLWSAHDVPRAIKHSPQYFRPINSKFSSHAPSSSRENTSTITQHNHVNTKLHYSFLYRRSDARCLQRKLFPYVFIFWGYSSALTVSRSVFPKQCSSEPRCYATKFNYNINNQSWVE